MALTLGSAKILNPGAPFKQVLFTIVLDGAATSATALALPTGFPVLQAQVPGTSSGTYTSTGPASSVVYQGCLGGTSAVVQALKIIPTAAQPTTQIDVTVSAAGTNGQTVQVMAIIYDQF